MKENFLHDDAKNLSGVPQKGPILDNLEAPITSPISEMDVVEPNIALVVAAVVLVICL